MGSQGGEDSRCRGGTNTGGVWDKLGRQSDHWQTLWPHICTDKQRAGLTVVESGAGRAAGSTLQPHIRAQTKWTNSWEQSRLCNPGLQRREIKPQTSD